MAGRMHRQTITWNSIPREIRLRGCTSEAPPPPVVHSPAEPVAASFPDQSGQPVRAAPPPPPDIRPLLESLGEQLAILNQRRQQSLLEMQQVALELSVAVASQLVFQAIDREQFQVEELVRQAVQSLRLEAIPTVHLHPKDLELLQKRIVQQPLPGWTPDEVQLHGDPGIARGGCRVESDTGRMLVSDIGLRLSEIRRHWMEELDDSQVERRRNAGEGSSLRRFPDRREIA